MNMLRILALALIFTTSACAANHYVKAPTVPEDDIEFAPPEEIVMPGLEEDPPEPLRLMPADVVTLTTVSADTQKYEGLIVDGTGALHIPLAGDVIVGHLTLTEAEKAIETALRRYDRFVRVNLVISKPDGHVASVLGAVNGGGPVPVMPGTRVADIIAHAGGPLRANPQSGAQAPAVLADFDGARLMRNGEAVPVNITRAAQGDPKHNVRVHAGDTLFVPYGGDKLIMVIGAVNQPQPLSYRPGLRLTEALARAGGWIPARGDRNDVRIVRGSLTAPRIYTASIKDLVNGEATDVILAPGDIVFVTETWIAKTGDVLTALAPAISLVQSAAFLGLANVIAQ